MGTRSGNRVGKLESDLFGKLTPSDRFRMVISAAAEGDTDQAHRIGQACSMETYRMADADYVDWLDEGHRLCKCAVAHFEKYASALCQIHGIKGLLCDKMVGMIASTASTQAVLSVWNCVDGDSVDWAEVDAAEVGAREFAESTTARMLDAMHGGLRTHLRADWAGFKSVSPPAL
jgi:hypothetical protein